MMPAVYRRLGRVALAAACCLPAGCRREVADPAATVRVSKTQPHMGVPWTITVYAADHEAGAAAIAAGFAEVTRLERILSDYDPDSELSCLSAAAPTLQAVPVGDDLWSVLVRGEEIRNLTDGAFDIAVGPLTTLWRQSRRSGHLPRPDKLAAARTAAGPGAIMLDRQAQAVSLTRPGMRLDPGGIGMGYTADRVLEVLRQHGVAAAMVDASGDIAVSAAPPGAGGWRIRVAGLPGDEGSGGGTVLLTQAAVTTSGDAHQAVEIDGQRYSHIVDPRTGLGVTGPAAVTVIAPDATTADALATAASVLGPDRGPDVVGRFPGCAARFIWHAGKARRHVATPGWPVRE
ncbi:MAG: FAD:protein FMN transferase [Pirellulales bacterium]